MIKSFFTLVVALIFSFAALTPAQAAGFQQKPATHLKKDGTPDKRFKNNKTPKGPVKKDGTADMRYKANKVASTPKKK